MAHVEQKIFCQKVRCIYPAHFIMKNVLDCGSLDINGNNRYLFTECKYIGLDIGPGNNVDVVSKIHEYRVDENNVFDTIISTECFEHDQHLVNSIKRIVELLKPDGLFLMTCATDGRGEHGTHRSDSQASPYTLDYYSNVPIDFFLEIGKKNFRHYCVEVNKDKGDLYFWGKNKCL